MKILIIHASAGAGHKKAAEAVYNLLKENPAHQAVFVDVLDYGSWLYQKTYRSTYTFLVTKLPFLWGFFFSLLDLPLLKWSVGAIRRVVNALNGGTLERFLIKEQFDCIFSTHFFPNEVISHLKRSQKIKSRLISVVTDFDVHSFWLGSGVDIYTAACEYTAEKLKTLGVPENKIRVCGIPTDKKFIEPFNKDALKSKLGLKKDVFTVLMATGSFGTGPIQKIAEGLVGCQVLIVCGQNKELFERLNAGKKDFMHVYPLVHNMHELMSVADVMVTKPGGLSISEALVKNLPMIFFSAIPGQEENNIRVLKSYGIGLSCQSTFGIIDEVQKLKASQEYLHKIKENIQKLAKPQAAAEIIKLIS